MTDDLLRAEREANRRLREEQEREYEESAAKDRARIKERRRLESERQEAVERELQKEKQVCRNGYRGLEKLSRLAFTAESN